MSEEKNTIIKKLKKFLFTAITGIIFIAILIGAGAVYGSSLWENKVEQLQAEVDRLEKAVGSEDIELVDEFFISGRLDTISELTTQKLTYSGVIEITDGKIPFITKKGFLMTYTAKIRAGVDLSQAVIKCTNDTVTITLPYANLQEIKVIPETIKFYDEKNSIFNRNEIDDVTAAITYAEGDVKGKGDISELLEQVDINAELLVKSLLMDVVNGREIIIDRF